MANQNSLNIEYLYFHYIDKNRDFDNLQHGGTHLLSDASIIEAYSDYFSEVVDQSISRKAYGLSDPIDAYGNSVRTRLEQLQRFIIPDQSEEFRDTGQWLAQNLTEKMRGNYPGVLFVGRFERSGRRHIGLFKLRWVDESYAELMGDNAELTAEHLVEKLPLAGKHQKGAIYPHPTAPTHYYMKVYQENSYSKYFNGFLGGVPPVDARDMMAEIRRLALKLTGGTLPVDQSISLYEAFSSHVGDSQRVIEEEQVTEIIAQVVRTPQPQIRDLVRGDLNLKGLVRADDVDGLRAKFYVGDIRLFGSFRSFSDRFNENEMGPHRHVIEGEVREFTLE